MQKIRGTFDLDRFVRDIKARCMVVIIILCLKAGIDSISSEAACVAIPISFPRFRSSPTSALVIPTCLLPLPVPMPSAPKSPVSRGSSIPKSIEPPERIPDEREAHLRLVLLAQTLHLRPVLRRMIALVDLVDREVADIDGG